MERTRRPDSLSPSSQCRTLPDSDALGDPTLKVGAAVRRELGIRASRLREQGYASYSEYIASPEWRQTRARYYASDLPQSCICGATKGLVLHHKTYERLGVERLTDLQPLCVQCHQMVHDLARRGDIPLDGVHALVSTVRAKQAKAAREARDATRAPELAERQAEDDRKAARSRAARLSETVKRAHERGLDIHMELAAIDASIAKIRSQLTCS